MSVNVGLTSYADLLECLNRLIECRLTVKQKAILGALVGNKLNATRLVDELAGKLHCSKSALWNNLRELREVGLVSWNGKCGLTEVGKLLGGGSAGRERAALKQPFPAYLIGRRKTQGKRLGEKEAELQRSRVQIPPASSNRKSLNKTEVKRE